MQKKILTACWTGLTKSGCHLYQRSIMKPTELNSTPHPRLRKLSLYCPFICSACNASMHGKPASAFILYMLLPLYYSDNLGINKFWFSLFSERWRVRSACKVSYMSSVRAHHDAHNMKLRPEASTCHVWRTHTLSKKASFRKWQCAHAWKKIRPS